MFTSTKGKSNGGGRSTSVFLVTLSIGYWLAPIMVTWLRSDNFPLHLDGYVRPGYEKVYDAFRQNLADGWEREGAALTVYHRGELIVDLWGGYADRQTERKWQKNTLSIAYSSTKAIVGICIAHMVERGYLSYDDRLADFWPKFGQHGKENITVQWILSHMGGLAMVHTEITEAMARDWQLIAPVFENHVPNWAPGTEVGYHALTFGWLVDQIVRRTDPNGRSIGRYFRQEIAEPYGIDFHIGLPISQSHRVTRLTLPSVWNRLDELWTDPNSIDYVHVLYHLVTNGILIRMGDNPPWLQSITKLTLNNPDYYTLIQPALLGIGTARSLAKTFQLVMDGQILNATTLNRISKPFIHRRDCITAAEFARGYGFTYLPFTHNQTEHILVGHAGLGGQNVRYDRENQLVFAYLSNGLKAGFGDTARTYVRLRQAIYDTIGRV